VLYVSCIYHRMSVYILCTSTKCMDNWFQIFAWATVAQEVEKLVSNQKVASLIPCRSVLEQDTEPLIAPDVQCAISVNVKCKMCIRCKSHICKSLWIKASAKLLNVNVTLKL